MGTLIYGPTATSIAIEDRDLAHLQTVILAKLRRSESFAFSWERPGEQGGAHTTLWMHPQMYLEFCYSSAKGPALNRNWVERLMARANSGSGLELVPEEPPL